MVVEQAIQPKQNQTNTNQFYFYINKELISWDIYAPQENLGFAAYFSKVLQTVDRALPNQGLIFYVTMTEMKELPSYGDNVFVFILGDEFYRIPDYADKVGAIFKSYGTHQIREQLGIYRPLLKPSYFKALMLGQSIKNLAHRLTNKIKRRFRKVRALLLGRGNIAPIYDIPPGYYNSENLPIKPIANRVYDTFFEGSMIQGNYPVWSLRYWSKTPKTYSREQMVENLQKFKDKYPQFQIKLTKTAGFALAGEDDDPGSYSQKMMNTKVCLAPRGTTLETYRLFEAMRYGCVIITEVLPPRWFYDGAPVIQIGNWQNLDTVLSKLLNNEMLLQALHEQTLEWWHTKCSEEVVGRFAAEKINWVLNKDPVFIPVALKAAPEPEIPRRAA
jgi:hypothetical protein